MPGFKANVKHLRTFATMAPRANQDKIRNIARLYEEKRIPNYQTAAKLAFQLSVPSSVKDCAHGPAHPTPSPIEVWNEPGGLDTT